MQILRQKLITAPAAMRPALEKPVKDEARLFLVQAVKITPPASQGVTGKSAQKQGEAAVARDIGQVYGSTPQAYKIIAAKDPKMAGAFYKAMLQGDFSEAQRLLAASGSQWRNVSIGTFDPGMHARARNRRGRVERHVPVQIPTDFTNLDKYIKKKQKNVGLLASGFNDAAAELDAKLPAWIRRHGVRAKGIRFIITAQSFLIIIENSAPWARAAEMQDRMTYVARYRQGALERKLKAIMAKESKKALTLSS